MVRKEVSGKVIRLLMALNDHGVTVNELYRWIIMSVEWELGNTEGAESDRLSAIRKALYKFEDENI
ncbi:hypothetical protein [Anoxybacillus kestanbolensis]|uniref:hypothetical protein n=1 Tax=Anoxybacillus kestanbolensis TaxID=227476 RepID=UPI003D256FB6